MEIQNVLAIISSLLNTLVLIFYFTLQPLINKIYNEDIVSEIITSHSLKQTPFNHQENFLKNTSEIPRKLVSPVKVVVKNDDLTKVEKEFRYQ